MKRVLQCTFLASVLSAIAFSATPSAATATPITGTADFESQSTYFFDFTGSGNGHSVSASSGTDDAAGPLVCSTHQVCSLFLPTGDLWGHNWPGSSTGQLDGTNADFLFGTLQLSFVAPVFGNDPANLTVPAVISGDVTGMKCTDLILCQQYGPLWSVAVTGAGNLNLLGFQSNNQDIIITAQFAFAGAAVPVPEPTTLAMLGAGLLGIVGWVWRRLRADADSVTLQPTQASLARAGAACPF